MHPGIVQVVCVWLGRVEVNVQEAGAVVPYFGSHCSKFVLVWVSYELCSRYYFTTVEVDDFDELCRFPRAETADVRKQISCVQVTDSFVNFDAAQVDHIHHCCLKCLDYLLVGHKSLGLIKCDGDDISSEGSVFLHRVLYIFGEGNTIFCERRKSRMFHVGSITALI